MYKDAPLRSQNRNPGSETKNAGEPIVSPALFGYLFAALSVLSILPFWTVRFPVLTDYPQHLARWFVLFHYQDPAYHFSSYYAPDWGPYAYVLADVIGVFLQHLLPVDMVGRCVLSICVVSVPLATLYFLRKVAPGNDGLALFGFLIAFNPLFLMGFVENQLSLALGLFVVGLWVAYCDNPRVLAGIAVSAGIVLLYLAHLVGFAVAGTAMGVYCLVGTRPWQKLLTLALASVPGLTLLAYNMKHAGIGGPVDHSNMTVWDKLRNLAVPLRGVSKLQDLIVIAGVAVFLYLLYKTRRGIVWQKPWLVVCAILLLVYLAAPGTIGKGGYLDVRIVPFVYLFALATVRITRISRTMVAVIVLLVIFRVGIVEHIFIPKQSELAELTAGFHAIPPGARVLSLNSLPSITLVGHGEVHHLAYGVIRNGFLVPSIAYLPGLQPLRVVGAGYCPNVVCEIRNPTDTDWGQVAEHYDYLWVQGVPFVPAIGEPVFSNEFVTVYRVRHTDAN